MPQIRIRYCRLCGYHDRAHALAAELGDRFSARVDVAEGKFGQFDVWIDDDLVSSRGEGFLRRMMPVDAPKQAQVIAAIEAHTALQEGERCELPKRDVGD